MKIESDGLPALDYLKDCFRYDGETGGLFWKDRPEAHFKNIHGYNVFNNNFNGKEVNTVNSTGRIIVCINRKRFLAHRVIFKICHGYCPPLIDHINRNPLDNRFDNLRPSTSSDNAKNQSLSKLNKTGIKGVSKRKGIESYKAKIYRNKKAFEIGSFKTLIEAAEARVYWEKKLGYPVQDISHLYDD